MGSRGKSSGGQAGHGGERMGDCSRGGKAISDEGSMVNNGAEGEKRALASKWRLRTPLSLSLNCLASGKSRSAAPLSR